MITTKRISPFEAQQQRIGTFARIKKAIRERASLSHPEEPATSLTQQAKTIHKNEITNNDFIDFINRIDSSIKNSLGVEGRYTVDDQNVISEMRERILPVWNSQFKRMFNRALREGKISIDRLNFFSKDFLRVTDRIGNTKEDLDREETASHTNTMLSYQPVVPRSQQIVDETLETDRFPKGSYSRSIIDQINNDQQTETQKQLNALATLEIKPLLNMETDAKNKLRYYKNIRDNSKQIEIENFISTLQQYIKDVKVSTTNIDKDFENDLRSAHERIVQEFNEDTVDTSSVQQELIVYEGQIKKYENEFMQLLEKYPFITDVNKNVRQSENYPSSLKSKITIFRKAVKKLGKMIEDVKRNISNLDFDLKTRTITMINRNEATKLQNSLDGINNQFDTVREGGDEIKQIFFDITNYMMAQGEIEAEEAEKVVGKGRRPEMHPFMVQEVGNRQIRKRKVGKLSNPLGVKSGRPNMKGGNIFSNWYEGFKHGLEHFIKPVAKVAMPIVKPVATAINPAIGAPLSIASTALGLGRNPKGTRSAVSVGRKMKGGKKRKAPKSEKQSNNRYNIIKF